jgi:hypothetical protein
MQLRDKLQIITKTIKVAQMVCRFSVYGTGDFVSMNLSFETSLCILRTIGSVIPYISTWICYYKDQISIVQALPLLGQAPSEISGFFSACIYHQATLV